MRSIRDILYFRADLSPFLVHLTKEYAGASATENLTSIIKHEMLIPSGDPLSDARFAVPPGEADDFELFGGISFSETPIAEIHSLFEIASREINLEPYGLVFLKGRLSSRGVAPVIYINNEQGDKDATVRALARLRNTDRAAACQILPLLSIFGSKLKPMGGRLPTGTVDFTWEREWRYPGINGVFQFERDDVFIGLCPDDEIRDFQRLYPPLKFIDPRRNAKWYATKLVSARRRLQLKYSVV